MATNVTNATQTFSVKATGADGLKITVTPKTFTLAPGAEQNLAILIDGTDTADGWHFGQVTLKAKKSGVAAVLPVAAKRGQGSVTLTHTCDPTELDRGEVGPVQRHRHEQLGGVPAQRDQRDGPEEGHHR